MKRVSYCPEISLHVQFRARLPLQAAIRGDLQPHPILFPLLPGPCPGSLTGPIHWITRSDFTHVHPRELPKVVMQLEVEELFTYVQITLVVALPECSEGVFNQ